MQELCSTRIVLTDASEDIDEKQEYNNRQSHITDHWGFQCSCAQCSLSPLEKLQSDARISRIIFLRSKLLDFSATRKDMPTTQMALELIKLYEEEHLHTAMAESYMLAAIWFCIWGVTESTTRFANMALTHWLVWEKKGAWNKKMLDGLMTEPTTSWCWGLVSKGEKGLESVA